jgi:hypothetical protein
VNVWESNNSGGNWSAISSWGDTNYYISAIMVNPLNDQVIYAAQSYMMEYTTNGGGSWTNISNGLPVDSTSITYIALDPAMPSHAWVTFSGYIADSKVFATTNWGTTWKNISSGLPNLPVNCIVSPASSHEAIYIGTDAGVYYRDTVTNTWIPYNNGMPNVIVNEMRIVDSGANLLAGTYGRGMWETPVNNVNTGVNQLKTTNYELRLYPNPNDGKFTIEMANSHQPIANSRIEIYNVLGQVIYTRDVSALSIIDCQLSINSGVYFYRVVAEDGELIGDGKFVIEK